MAANWTDQEREACLKMFRAGRKEVYIACVLGKTPRSVVSFIWRERKKEPSKWRERRHPAEKVQPCGSCFYGSGATDQDGWKCPWPDRFEPVPGWDATPTVMYHDNCGVEVRIDSFEIHKCPKYVYG